MGKRVGDWELITSEDFTQEFLDSLVHGQVMGFKQVDGTMKHWKVCRIDRKRGKWWIKPWRLYRPDEMEQLEADREAN